MYRTMYVNYLNTKQIQLKKIKINLIEHLNYTRITLKNYMRRITFKT